MHPLNLRQLLCETETAVTAPCRHDQFVKYECSGTIKYLNIIASEAKDNLGVDD